VGLTVSLSDAAAGGTWSSSNTLSAVGLSSGVVTGVAPGTSVISYSNICGTSTLSVTVNAGPGSVTGTLSVCIGASTPLSDASSGGTWSSSNTALATISAAGVAYGVAQGTPVITYGGPSACYRVATLSVNNNPAAITGPTQVCTGSTI